MTRLVLLCLVLLGLITSHTTAFVAGRAFEIRAQIDRINAEIARDLERANGSSR